MKSYKQGEHDLWIRFDKNKASNQFCVYKKPKYTNKEEQDYYNAVYKKVYTN